MATDRPAPADRPTAGVPNRSRGTEPNGDPPLEMLSESECWRLLRSVEVGRIAMAVDDGTVEIFPINYLVDHGTIVFRTATGTKLSRLGQAREVSFEADDAMPDGTAWSVVVKGSAATISGRSDVLDSFAIDLHPWHGASKPFFVRLEPRLITGRRFVRTR